MAQDARDSYPVELTPPDISPYRAGNTGVDYVTSFRAPTGGPHVMLVAVIHGNELCGAIALDHILRHDLRPRRGRLTLAFANVEAYGAFDPADPTATRFIDEDMNRLWSPRALDAPATSAERRRVRELRPLVDEVDLLLDIHSMQHRTAPLMMAGSLAKGRALAASVGVPELVVSDAGHRAGTRLRDYGGFGDPDSPRNALLVECGQHWERASADMAIETALRFLVAVGSLDAEDAAPHLPTRRLPAEQRHIEVVEAVTIASDDFAFVQDFRGLEVIGKAGELLAYDGGRPVVTPFDDCVLIMPSRRLEKGATAVRLGRFVTPSVNGDHAREVRYESG